MKKKSDIILVLGICSAFFMSACVDRFAIGDAFLEKAPGVDVNIDTVFNNAEYTRNFLWSAYGQIYCTYTSGNMMNGSPIDALSDSYQNYCGWGGPLNTYYPGTLTEEKLREYRELGINRLSIGLQSAHDNELKTLGRIHTWQDFLKNYQLARRMGFRNINVDLMQSLPGQSLADWKDTLEKVVQLLPEHISAYSLTLEEGTPFYRYYTSPEGKRYMPDEETDRAMYHYTGKYLAQHGYHRYEISNYARGDHECRHNITYWTLGDYIGFGQSAASYLAGKRFSNPRGGQEYRLYIPEAYNNFRHMPAQTPQEAVEEFMFLGLRMMRGISEEEFARRFGVSYEEVYGPLTDRLVEQKLLTRRNGRVALTEYGIDVSNQVLSQFLL